ncbi:unnamed protein product [Ranitomeya imitator]|uniref:Gypsy retrotransposon integrase-like protein 1 n=1 Tax=Ranitomeya imitator TaxID=111125 RepID=A0ABN9LDM4_9NEOB|nr:unnamed protein product [Ranitomeya imitator]
MADEQRLQGYIQLLEGRLASLERATSAVDVTAIAVQAASVAAAALPTATSVPTLSHLPLPERYSGDSKSCRGFVSQCGIHLELLAARFPTERAKVGFIISLLSDRALEWATPLWERKDHVVRSAPRFLDTLKQVFLGPQVTHDTALQLLALTQGSTMVSHFAVHFRTLASELEWPDKTLIPVFWRGLADHVKDALATREIPATLEELIAVSTRIDLRFNERRLERAQCRQRFRLAPTFAKPLESPVQASESHEALEVTRAGSKSQSARAHKVLHVCQQSGHLASKGPQRSGKHQRLVAVGGGTLDTATFASKLSFKGTITIGPSTLMVELCVDSGAEALLALCRRVFSKRAAETLPPHRPYDCPIDLLPGAEPPRGRVYPLSLPETEAMSQYIQENLARGFIRKSVSPAGARFFFVQKKTGDLRPCIDYRGLNAITVKNKYPLPLISELFDRLRGARVFTKLDLRGAYNLIRIREGDKWKTAFNTRDGHYEYLVMPFGLCNAPAVFQDFVNDIFRDMLTTSVVVYLDDILIFSPDIDSHRRDVRKVFDLLRANSLYAKLEKCVFEQESLPFLGYIISAQGLAMDPAKLQAVMDWQEPHSLKAVQRFMGFINYYRQFIPHFSTLVAPLVALTKKGANPKLWSEEVSKAFLSIKSHFASAPILHRPDVDKPFILEVDASSVGAGAVLFQKDAQGRKHPCFFFSKTFTPAERNYSIGDRELLAMKLAFSEWRHLLEGARFPFQVFTDHKNLVYLQTAQRLNSRQARWSLFFSRFHFTLHFLSGEKNVRADALSRSVVSSEEEEEEPRLIVPSESLRTVAPVSLESVPPGKTFVPANLRPEVLSWAHSSRVGGHFGTKRTSELLARTYWWPHMARDVKDYIQACVSCAQNRSPWQQPAGLLYPLPVADRPWEMVGMDFVVGLPMSRGCSIIWVVTDHFSKMVHLVPLPRLPSARALAVLFIKHVFRLHGMPDKIVSDWGPQFASRFWRELCRLLSIELNLSSAYHPETNGLVERTNQTLVTYLRHFVSARQDDWASLLPWAEFALNNAVADSTGQTPFLLNYGQHPRVPVPMPVSSTDSRVADWAVEARDIWDRTQDAIRASKERMRVSADTHRRPAPVFAPGDLVWLSARNIRLRVESTKFAPRYIGPFKVLEQVNPVVYRLAIPPRLGITDTFHVSLLKPVHLSRFSESSAGTSGSSTDEFEVNAIVGCKVGSIEQLNYFMDVLNMNNLNLKLTFSCGRQVNFLDLDVSVSAQGSIETNVYRKPTATNTLLHASSSHRQSTINGITIGQHLRIKRICSSQDKFQIQARDLYCHFRERGYSHRQIRKGYKRACSTSRNDLLYRTSSKDKDDTQDLVEIVNKHWGILQSDPILKTILPDRPSITAKRSDNLRDLLVHSHYSPNEDKRKGVGCQNHVKSKDFYNPQEGRSFKIRHRLTCASKGVIYHAQCPCNKVYIGMTTRELKIRTREHVHDIEKAKTSNDISSLKTLPRHFFLFHDSNASMLKIKAIDQISLGPRGGDLFKALARAESRWIYRLNTVTPGGLNEGFGFGSFL